MAAFKDGIAPGASPKAVNEEDNPFTHYYAQLLHQGNMLADDVRTGTYQKAMLDNREDFEGKVVLDVGTGTGILAFFACQAGAKKVYAVDASDSADVARTISEANGYGDRVEVIKGKIEEIELPEKVDIIISEPIGFLLVHERMLESYAAARERFLKPGGVMFPTTGSIFLAPITDAALYQEQEEKIVFWNQTDFYGIDMTCVLPRANIEYFSQPVVGYFDPSTIVSSGRTKHTVDFRAVLPEELHEFTVEFAFRVDKTSIMHGLGGWFDIDFQGSDPEKKVVLSTAPDKPGTHWYQCRLLYHEPLAVNKGQTVRGSLHFKVNEKYSYCIKMTASIDGTNISTSSDINLHDQIYHYLYTPQVEGAFTCA